MRPNPRVPEEYIGAFREIARRIQASISDSSRKRKASVVMYVAGGAAVQFYTGARISLDVDAAFSSRLLLPEDLDVAFRGSDGKARMLYFDRQYNETLGLLHDEAHADSRPLEIEGVDRSVLDVRLLSPVDVAVSKIARLQDYDQADIRALASEGLITEKALRLRATEALADYVGDVARARNSIEIACGIVREARQRATRRTKRS